MFFLSPAQASSLVNTAATTSIIMLLCFLFQVQLGVQSIRCMKLMVCRVHIHRVIETVGQMSIST